MDNMKYTNISDELTIVIPCYNEVNYIGKTLMNIGKQVGIKGTRVIVCDGKSTDSTREVIKGCEEELKDVLKIEIQNGGKVALGRNVGANLSKTPYILFLDADSILLSDTQISDALLTLKDSKVQLVTCKVKSVSKSLRSKLAFKLFNVVNHFVSKKTPFAVGTFFLTTKKSFMHYGQFDETLQHSEDYCLSKKYRVREFKILNHYVGQDDRRFRKMGYTGMIRLLIKSYVNRRNPNFFRQDVGYW